MALTKDDLREIISPPRDIAPPYMPRTIHHWLSELQILYNEVVGVLKRQGDGLESYPEPSSQGIKSDYVTVLDADLLPGSFVELPNDYIANTTEFYWEGRRLVRMTDSSIAAGSYHYHEEAGADGSYSRVWLVKGMRKKSNIVIYYTQDTG